jgi:serine/threonine-protein kinase
MAEVYLGVAVGAEGFQKPVAVKRVLPQLANDESVARMFLSEAKLATFLNHQNIVQVFDVGRGPDGLFIVMELVNGWDLGVVIDQAAKAGLTLSPALSAFIASQALAGLCHAYKQTHRGKRIIIAHRDLSPSNLLISSDGEVKVADFGIARLEAFSNRTDPGTFKGKIAYAAPEVLKGQPATEASDQFSLAVVLHEMLAGRHPFGIFENSAAYVEAIIHQPAAELHAASLELSEIIGRAMAKSPAERFESPEAFALALARYLASTGTPSTTHELAEFIRGLPMPRLPSQFPEQDTQIRGRLPGSFSLKGVPSIEAAASSSSIQAQSWAAEEMDAFQSEWSAAGPALDASGALQDVQAPKPPSPSFQRQEPDRLELAYQRPSVSASAADVPSQTAADPAGSLPSEPGVKYRAAGFGGALKWVVLAALVTGGVLERARIYQWVVDRAQLLGVAVPKSLPILGHAAEARVLSIESEPSGANVRIGNEKLGETPLFLENLYPSGDVEIRLSLRGFQPWTGKFAGGQAAAIKARLKRR